MNTSVSRGVSFCVVVILVALPDACLCVLWFQGKIAHAVVMPSVTVEKLDDFVSELVEARNQAFPDGNVVVPCIVEEVGVENCACSAHRNIASQKTRTEERKHFSSK